VVAGSNWWIPPSEAAILASQLRWPFLAEPVSGLRHPAWALAAGQALLGSDRFVERHRPEVVLQIGATPTSRATLRFVAGAERLVVVDLFHMDPDPERRASWRLQADPDRLARQLIHRVPPVPDDWLAAWTDLDERERLRMPEPLPEVAQVGRQRTGEKRGRDRIVIGDPTEVDEPTLAVAEAVLVCMVLRAACGSCLRLLPCCCCRQAC
jgi:2-succinyl-5-enolpyruvyl-6-hydroxy-3-cyclohexene-1-carboxylate synthase